VRSVPLRLMNILSLSSVFPNPAEPGLGLFVRSRLSDISRLANIKVIAPIAALDYSHPKGRLYCPRTGPWIRTDGAMEVFHPRWVFPPGGTPANVVCLASRLYPLVRRLHSQFAFDLIDAHFGYPEGVTAALLARAIGIPFTVTLRGSELMFASYRSRRLAMQWALRRASKVICVSEELRRFAVTQGAAPAKVVTISNGVDEALFYPRDRGAVRSKHGISLNRRVIVSAGEMIEAKGHQHVAAAVRDLVGEGIDAELLIVGSRARGGRAYDVTLKEFVKNLGLGDRIRFIGFAGREGVAELLSAADVFCLASYTEGWPNVVHEALACGTPVVATQVGAIPEMIPSADYGLVTPVRDQSALLSALRSALAKDWDRARIEAWGGSRTWARVTEEVLTVFESIAGRKKALASGEISIPAGGH
jgi:teichuronic acid biosynthesis glycosyltransferase TuaC